MLEQAAAVGAAYLASSVSFPYWIARAYGVDLRRAGSGKLGGSNLGQTVSALAGLIGGLLDAAKGFFAVLIPRALGLPLETQLVCGVVAVAGQMWPIYHRFDGGRGNATGWAFALAADPIAAAIMLVPVGAAASLRTAVRPHPTKLVPTGALASFAVFPAVIWEALGITPTVVAGRSSWNRSTAGCSSRRSYDRIRDQGSSVQSLRKDRAGSRSSPAKPR